MKYGYLILRTNGKIELVSSNLADFSLKELQDGINCDTIHIVQGRVTDMLLVIDDEGKLQGKPINPIATLLYQPEYDFIVGDVIVGTSWNADPYAEPDVYKMPLEMVKRYQAVLQGMIR